MSPALKKKFGPCESGEEAFDVFVTMIPKPKVPR